MQVPGNNIMNIVVVGAGAIGSLYGALLAQKNTVVLVGRSPHITTIQHDGLTIKGRTRAHVRLLAVESMASVTLVPDLVILTVKSYDTEAASKQIRSILHDTTMLLSLQNGIDNIEKIERYIDPSHLLAGVSMHGAILSKPGEIIHSGRGDTILGEIHGSRSGRLETLVRIFSESGLQTKSSDNIRKEIWMKAIINSSINPITAFFGCKNGYLLENPLVERIVERVCMESTAIACAEGMMLSPADMVARTKEVIRDTAQNYSSMLQSIQQKKRTEIDSINGKLMRSGLNHNLDVSLNRILTELITSLSPSPNDSER